ncbi:MAG: hypothetical protein HYT12_03675 [Candidatus Liptonbacteria bacterium]|nr:hypothetical protein [Candidatus Liptonbacteria bacterium]
MENKSEEWKGGGKEEWPEELEHFFKYSKILPEDVPRELLEFPSDLIIETMHNLFNLSREQSADELRNYMAYIVEKEQSLTASGKNAENDFDAYKLRQTKKLYEYMLAFVEKYGWEKSFGLVRNLEEINPKHLLLKEFYDKQKK